MTILILACMLSAPTDCREYAVEVEPGLMCHLLQPAIAQWQAEHPDRRVARWWCA